MITLYNNFFKLKKFGNIVSYNRYRYISSAILNESRGKLKHLGDGCIHLDKEEDSGIAIITLDNPSKKNAISGKMMIQLESIVDNLENWESGKGVILTSVGDVFCSGSDLSFLHQVDLGDGILIANYMKFILNKIYSLNLVTVSLVHNKTFGGGSELTTSTDYRVFADVGSVYFLQGKMGLTPGWGGGTRLVKSFGPRFALELLCSGRQLGAEEALKSGYADHIVIGNDKLADTKQWLNQRLIHPPVIIQAMKKMVIGGRDLTIDDSFKYETEIFSKMWGGPLNLKALNKYLNPK